jgi:hypothetical protein
MSRLSLVLGGGLLIGSCTAVSSKPISLAGTLVVVVPSKEGLVVAADSRSSVGNTHCDSAYKIIELNKPARTVATVTGYGIFAQNPGPAVQDICEYLKEAPRLLDIEQVVKEYVEKANVKVANIRIDDLAKDCLAALQRFKVAFPLAIPPFAGRELFNVVLAGYDSETKTATIRFFVIRVVPSTLDFEVIKISQVDYGPQSTRDYAAFGETDYLNKHVFGGEGRKFVNSDTIAFLLNEKKTVSETSVAEAVAIATNLIDATARTTEVIPAPTGIGGPIDVVLIGQDEHPQRLRWK